MTAILVACANGGALDDGSTDNPDNGTTGDDSGTSQGGDEGGSPSTGGDDSGNPPPPTDDSGGNPPPAQDDSGGNPPPAQDASPPPPQDASPPPQDAAPPPKDASPPPQDSAPPPPQDSGPVCNKPSGNPCALAAPQCGCAANQKCDIDPSNATVDVCVNTSSSGTQGAACNQYPDCSAGFACICTATDPFSGSCTATECEAWCIIGGANTCTNGTTCKGLGTTITLGGQKYGTCQ